MMLSMTASKAVRFFIKTSCLTALCASLGAGTSLSLFAADSKEVQVGNGLDHARLARDILVLDAAVNRRVAEIGEQVAKQCGRSDLRFTFRVVNDSQVNAFATSGGFVYINTGLLEFCESEAELAAVIAHEVTHISERHLLDHLEDARNKAISGEVKKILIELALRAAGGAAGAPSGDPSLGGQLGDLGGQISQLIGVSVIDPATQASILGYKKDQELEADKRAVKYLMDAGFDPHALVSVFDKMQGLRDKMIANHEPLACGWINKQPGLAERAKLIKELVSKGQVPELTKENGGKQ